MKNINRCSTCGFLNGEKENLTGCIDILLLLRSGQSSRDVDPLTTSRIRDDIDTLESDINLLDEQIARLEHKRKKAREALAQCKSFLAPIWCLIPDILVKIFSMLSVDTLCIDKPPWVLTHVCVWWRTLLYSSSTLWSTIRAGFSYKYSNLDMIRRSLQLSRDSPLDIVLADTGSQVFSLSMLEILLTAQSRWESLAMWVPNTSVSDPRSIPEPLPNLKELRVTANLFRPPKSVINTFSCARNLTRVRLDRLTISDVIIPLPQLTHLSVSFRNQKEFVYIVKSCKSLIHLDLSYDPDSHFDSFDIATTQIIHPVLRSLRWRHYCPFSFDYFSFPALETLSIIDNNHSLDGSAIHACENLIQRSKSSIHNLTLELPADADLRLFTLSSPVYSSITYLKMTITITSRAADPKLVLLADTRLLPHLAHLTAVLCAESALLKEWDLKASHFNETLQARWEHGRLKKLTILLNSTVMKFPSIDAHGEMPLCTAGWHIRLNDMRRLRTEGLDVTVWCKPYLNYYAHFDQPEIEWRKLRDWDRDASELVTEREGSGLL
ncbi:uncharacterized protein ARMOST_18525 [Armillaria ostoyae]|uniref:F-box domain-containing protein n=1 Tax=Armillaria ostoyae TaxID=47428 RepID=A0A284S213_ARMOS|nr:uncharacterized protein ARMOST_18525 [Armillaria ostoyae]